MNGIETPMGNWYHG